jgi:hypothetical protein
MWWRASIVPGAFISAAVLPMNQRFVAADVRRLRLIERLDIRAS